ncbi:MAG TPA: hypothetical protein VMT32_05980 [Bryobacteraceae bacterium]|nr:hypothetical protein [Bryobacteraceae bacterium]
MASGDKMDRALAAIRSQSGGRAESEYVSKQEHPERETRPAPEKERFRDWYSRVQPASNERSDWSGSGWSGGSMGGHNWSGGRER